MSSRHNKPPIFVIGSPRSGTTLFRLILTCHPNIVIPPECGFAVWLWTKHNFKKYDLRISVEYFLQELVKCRKFETWQIPVSSLRKYFEVRQPISYADAVSAVYECYGEVHDIPFTRWGDKNNFYLSHIEDIATIFPEAIFLHIVRDGRNVACSYKRVMSKKIISGYAPSLPVDIESIANQWNDNLRKINDSFDRIGRERIFELRLEDLKEHPKTVMHQVCQFINEIYDPGMLQYHFFNQEKALEPKEFLQWKEDTVRPLIQTRDMRYKQELSSDDLKKFEKRAWQSLHRYGYLI